jgi:hypothetical protein
VVAPATGAALPEERLVPDGPKLMHIQRENLNKHACTLTYTILFQVALKAGHITDGVLLKEYSTIKS